jgi:hypothetical protein
VSINDEHDLRERLDRAFGAIVPGPAPVDGTVRRGKGIRWRRRAAGVAGVAAVVAAATGGIPSVVGAVRHSAPPASSYTATVQAPGPHAPAGLIASGTVNGKRWALTADKPGSSGVGPDQQFFASGAAFGSARPAYTGPPSTAVTCTPSTSSC